MSRSLSNDFIYTSRAKDAVLVFLQRVFGLPGLFRDQPNIYRYSDDEKSSKIMIADFNTANLNSIHDKPALLVFRGTITPQTLGIGDKTNQTFLAGVEERELLLNVGMSIRCYSREGLEAEMLAVIVFKLIRYLNEDIQKLAGIFDIEAQGIGSEQIIKRESTSEITMVPVATRIQVPDAIKINFNEIQLSELKVQDKGQDIVIIETDIE